MDNDKLNQIADLAIRKIKEGHHLTPVLFIEDTRGKMSMVMIENFKQDNMHDIMRSAGKKFATFMPKTITFVCEAWHTEAMSQVGKDVHDMPRKQECITITCQEIGGEASMHMIPFSRVGKDIVLGESQQVIGKGGSILKSFWQGVTDAL